MLSFYLRIYKSAAIRFLQGHWLLPALLLLAVILSLQSSAQPNITRVEYYIDTDPGYGNATALTIPGNTTVISNASIPINPASISEGVHRLYVRAKSSNGWSMTNKWLFYKPYGGGVSPPPPAPAPNITRIEYYFDIDPGFGNATALPAAAATNLANLIIPVDPTNMTEGVHRLYVRAKSSNGWSLTNKWLFYKPYGNGQSVPATPVPNLAALEYYIDTDPGIGNGVPVAIEPVKQIAGAQLFINISGLPTGVHRLYVRGKDSAGSWSMVNDKLFNITAAQASPSLIVNSITRTTFCARDSFTIGYHVAGTYNAGNTFKVYLSNGSGSFAAETEIGAVASTKSGLIKCYLPTRLTDGTGYKLRIKSSNTAVTGATSSSTLTIYDRPDLGKDSTFYIVCQGEKVNLVPAFTTAGYTIKWTTPTPESVGVGVYRLSAVNANGCTDTVYATVKQDVGTWTGTTSNNWHTPANWSNGHVPTEKTHVIVPAGTANPCVLKDADGIAASIQIKPGGNMQVTNGRQLGIKARCNPLPLN